MLFRSYFPNQGFDLWNYVATWGSYLLGAAVLIFVANAILTSMKPADAPSNPWEAATLEWAVPSPPPAHNFDFEPVVYSRYPLWDIDVEDEHSASSSHAPSVVALAPTTHSGEDSHADDGHGGGHAIHLPAPTIYPMIFALGLNLLEIGRAHV